jgi:hypothetical protein
MLHVSFVGLTATMLLIAGCGGSSKSPGITTSAPMATTTIAATVAPSPASVPTVKVTMASGKPLSRAKWIAEGDAICAHFNQELNKLSVKSTSELPRELPQAAVYIRSKVAELSKLVPPTSKASAWQEILNGNLQVAEYATKLATYTTLGNAITKTPLAKAITRTDNHTQSLATSIGFKDCSR